MVAMESGGASPMPQTATPLKGDATGTPPPDQRKTKICVYCGASPGSKPEHMEAARQLARVMAANDIGLGESTRNVALRPLPPPLHPQTRATPLPSPPSSSD